ncbi:MAG: hypothetical protein EHM91_00080 [Planctomycetota bacterium]|nr:MAG: hypothetical protein EHM91_00080 [Planctomycetota bacterium]
MFDAHKNLAIATVTTATGAAGTTLGVAAGEGARFPAVPFNATVWPFDMAPDPTTAEVVRVTARTADSLTITRAQEGTTARAIIVGDLIAATITAQSLTDIESGRHFPSITTATVDGADTGVMVVSGGGAAHPSRGACLNVFGNEFGSGRGGNLELIAGEAVTGGITFYTGAEAIRGRIHPSGGFSWGHVTDPGAANFDLLPAGQIRCGPVVVGQPFAEFTGGSFALGVGSTSTLTAMAFYNPNGQVGSIWFLANSVQYNTTSDARLKADQGALAREASGEVLRRTVVHDFTWRSDGTPGRGVFAQEAVAVAPFAVSVGSDDTDDQGRLKQPWGVDYTKYVPDLIVGWQAHDATVAALEAKVAALEAAVADLLTRLG